MICKSFLPFSRLPFHFVDGFLCCAEASYVLLTPLITLLKSKVLVTQGYFSNRRLWQRGIYICWTQSSHSRCCVPTVLLWSHWGGMHWCCVDTSYIVRNRRWALGRFPGVGELWVEICRLSRHWLIKIGREEVGCPPLGRWSGSGKDWSQERASLTHVKNLQVPPARGIIDKWLLASHGPVLNY